MAFVTDRLHDGRRFRILTVVDNFTRKCPFIEAEFFLSGTKVAEALQRLAERRGFP